MNAADGVHHVRTCPGLFRGFEKALDNDGVEARAAVATEEELTVSACCGSKDRSGVTRAVAALQQIATTMLRAAEEPATRLLRGACG